ncbi:hypothetical protein HanXRQr2_Chr09g0401061 [Helianthus annuus]|uniref:Uncharacterized protein n=1 Tax=Helianthus annuus TaxID=4232 RepID=A0A9K3I815_HELAN|nr:hypothetical protein HanXRQr2_Chr09g0401061 [Helianthus annuus]
MFTPNCRRCLLAQKLTSFVLNVSKSYTLCPLGQTQLDFLVKLNYKRMMAHSVLENKIIIYFYSHNNSVRIWGTQ